MKRLLTYGLLLLTILASHFVVSACQDDSDKTTIVMTFTTRVENPRLDETTGESAEVLKEQMKELRIIMAREDGTVIYNEKTGVVGNEHEFSFDVPMMTYKERFQFVVIANETALVSSNGTAIDLSNVDKADFNNLKTLKIGQDGFSLGESPYIPQTIYWAQDIIYGETTKIRKELQFVVGKITVEFENQTEEPQSLSDIHIKGIIPNAQGYLLAQASNDFVGTQHDASAMQAADIIFNSITDLSVGGSSPIQHYYTYPVGTYGVASSTLSFTQSEKTYEQPTLFATWNGIEYNLPITEVTDEEGNVHPFTSLARNERLKIVITLTPAGDITVNYTIDDWKENKVNIGDTPPTTPPGNEYNVDEFKDAGDIEIGGNDNNFWELGNGTTIKGEEVNTGWEDTYGLDAGLNDVIQNISLPNNMSFKDIQGYIILLEFVCYNDNGRNADGKLKFDVLFLTNYDRIFSKRNLNDDGTEADPFVWNDKHESGDENESPYVRYVKIDADVIDFIYNNNNSSDQTLFNVKVVDASTEKQEGIQIALKQFKLIRPTTYSNQ